MYKPSLDFSISLKPTQAFPLDARSYFTSLLEAQTAAETAQDAGSEDTLYYKGQTIVVVEDGKEQYYIIDENCELEPFVMKDQLAVDKSLIVRQPSISFQVSTNQCEVGTLTAGLHVSCLSVDTGSYRYTKVNEAAQETCDCNTGVKFQIKDKDNNVIASNVTNPGAVLPITLDKLTNNSRIGSGNNEISGPKISHTAGNIPINNLAESDASCRITSQTMESPVWNITGYYKAFCATWSNQQEGNTDIELFLDECVYSGINTRWQKSLMSSAAPSFTFKLPANTSTVFLLVPKVIGNNTYNKVAVNDRSSGWSQDWVCSSASSVDEINLHNYNGDRSNDAPYFAVCINSAAPLNENTLRIKLYDKETE